MKVIPTVNRKYDSEVVGQVCPTYRKASSNNVAFGSLGSSAKDLTTGAFKWIDKKGFFMEFLIVDAISLILPRIWIGLNRDKDKTGSYNYQAGAEEAGREITSGPSMNLIPLGLAYLMWKAKPASHIEKDVLGGLTHSFIDVANTGKEKLHERFADKLFDGAFGSFNLDNKDVLKARFSELLKESSNLTGKELKAKAKEFEELVVLINNTNKTNVAPASSKTLSLLIDNAGKTIGASALDLFADFRNYSKDIIEKFVKRDSVKGSVEDFLKGITKNRIILKSAMAVTSFFAAGSFLLCLPRLCQFGKTSPAEQSAKRAQGGFDENK